ncbi:hypothetical protein ACMDCR_08995 [Labrys okinawensis]|uniref:hypothetical protein n=1 Tax=Labrys okinawensis TaxID=346911 RepID=UPI0039BC2C66
MLDYAIAFFLGGSLAGLFALAMVPAIWARARRLIRREMETALPLSMTQVRAAQDHVRAEAAMTHRRLEQKLERERGLRHDLMAEHGRQSERLRRVEALVGIDANRLGTVEEGAASAQRDVLNAQHDLAALKAELAAARVTIALRDDKAAEHERDINAARINNDSLRVELVALRTKLSAAEDGAVLNQRGLQQVLEAVAEKDDRLAVQAIDLMRAETAIAALEARAASLQHEFQAMTDRRHASETERADLDTRLANLTADMRRRDAALAERDARLAIAAGREAELVTEVARLRRSNEPGAADGEIATLRLERARLQAELAALREDAHESWLRIEADNRMLRREMAQVAAAIAREVASRQAIGVAPAERFAANDQDNAAKGAAAVSDTH